MSKTASPRPSLSKESSPKSLPRIKKAELSSPVRTTDAKVKASEERSRVLWIIIFAFAMLAVFGFIVWAITSGRSDGKIHTENYKQFKESTSEERDEEN